MTRVRARQREGTGNRNQGKASKLTETVNHISLLRKKISSRRNKAKATNCPSDPYKVSQIAFLGTPLQDAPGKQRTRFQVYKQHRMQALLPRGDILSMGQ